MSLAMGAAPKAPKKAEQEVPDGVIGYDIKVIGGSPFGKAGEGQEIVALLNGLNKNGKIAYGNTSADDGRGDWDGENITVNEEFRERVCSTCATLVHEGSHALWRKKHPKPSGNDKKALFKDAVEDELHAQENELIIYTWLRNSNKDYPADFLLDTRLQRKNAGTLKSVIEENFSAILK
jgi:hypothetical protein